MRFHVRITDQSPLFLDSVDAKDKEDFQAELDLMKKLDAHPNVVQLLGCCKGKGMFSMIHNMFEPPWFE